VAEMKTLHDAFVDEIRDVYNAEKQLVKALPKMVRNASDPELRKAFEAHLGETEGHVSTLEAVFEMLGEKARGKQCDGMAGILEEAKSALEEGFDPVTLDAVLIAAAQRVEHYEITAYGTLITWAKTMGHADVARSLKQIIAQEESADRKLSALAEGGINQKAAAAVPAHA
jgi:ferritin-like metal-binding protein YciE